MDSWLQLAQTPGSIGSKPPISRLALDRNKLLSLHYAGHALIKRDTDNLKGALNGTRVEEVFIPSVSPATLQILPNKHHKRPEDYTWALEEAMRQEYRAIVDAGYDTAKSDDGL
jgi:hypothetical protein